MNNIIQFPSPKIEDKLEDLLDAVESLLASYSAEQIILAMFEKAKDTDDIKALMPVFKTIVDKQ